jgi:hypothetical protein
MEFCTPDKLYLLVFVAILNILLYAAPCVKFNSFWYKSVFAIDLGVFLKLLLEGVIGPADGHWPQGTAANLFITLSFSCFFYVMAPNIWGMIFLILGLMSVQPFWDGLSEQGAAFMENSLDISMNITHQNWFYTVIVLAVFGLIGMACFFSIPCVQRAAMGVSTAVKLVLSLKILEIKLIRGEEVCCAPSSESKDNCPLWLNKWLWLFAVLFAAFRIAAAKKFAPPEPEGYCCSRKKKYKKVPTDTDDDESDGELPSKADTEAQTKQKQTDTKPKTTSLQSVRVLPSSRRYHY